MAVFPMPSPHGLVGERMPVFPGFPMFPGAAPRMPTNQTHPAFKFSQAELDMLLYGYALPMPNSKGHALSGLSVSELPFGLIKSKQPLRHDSSIGLPEGQQHATVFSAKMFPKGHKFGPFEGRPVNASEIKTGDGNDHMWEIFLDGSLNHFIDGRGPGGNWMSYVNCARHAQEQNLAAIQTDGKIYYEVCADIPEGKELLVWYGNSYNLFLDIPLGIKGEGSLDESAEAKKGSDGYTCERCGKVFAYQYYKDKHLKYTRCVDQGDRKFPCTLCSRSFEKRDRLRIHILHVHEKHRPHKCTVCNKCFSQSSSLNKHMRVHSGERPYKCVYCNKAFTASSILRTHIRQHSGEKPFKCKFCGKAFASHAAHDSHVRRTHAKEKLGNSAPLSCHLCNMTFNLSYELKLHMNLHNALHQCQGCGKHMPSSVELRAHVFICHLHKHFAAMPQYGMHSDWMAHEHLHSPTLNSSGLSDTDDSVSSIPGTPSVKRSEEIDVVA